MTRRPTPHRALLPVPFLFALLLLLSGLVVVGGALPDSPAAADPPAARQTDEVAEGGTRTIPAYKSKDGEYHAVRAFKISFRAYAGERRYISARVQAKQPSSTPDQLLMATANVVCYRGKQAYSASATQNLLRGKSATWTPRMVFVVPGDVREDEYERPTINCYLVLAGSRPRPASGPASKNVWLLGEDSFLAVSSQMPSWARTMDNRGIKSKRLDKGRSMTTYSKIVTLDEDVEEFNLISDHKVTVCSTNTGSRDETTGGKELCQGHVSKSVRSSQVAFYVVAQQLRESNGEPCASPQVVENWRRVSVARDVHHKMVYSKNLVKLNPDCGHQFEITTRVKVTEGADTVVHGPSEMLTIVPDS